MEIWYWYALSCARCYIIITLRGSSIAQIIDCHRDYIISHIYLVFRGENVKRKARARRTPVAGPSADPSADRQSAVNAFAALVIFIKVSYINSIHRRICVKYKIVFWELHYKICKVKTEHLLKGDFISNCNILIYISFFLEFNNVERLSRSCRCVSPDFAANE